MPTQLGRAVQKRLRENIQKSRKKWYVRVANKNERKVIDLVMDTGKHNVIAKVKTTRGSLFRYSVFTEEELDLMLKFSYRSERNVSFVFFYFAEEKKLISVDIVALLSMKTNKLTVEALEAVGYHIRNWREFGKHVGKVKRVTRNHPIYRYKRCKHHWMLESLDQAYRRTRRRTHSMGYCRKCGIVSFKFENTLKPVETLEL